MSADPDHPDHPIPTVNDAAIADANRAHVDIGDATTLPDNAAATARVAVIGAGPAGLMAAEVLAQAGVAVAVFDAMPSVGRKFLMAGKGGMNLTHSEPYPAFLSRYGNRQAPLTPLLDKFTPSDLREWVHGLGVDTFVGSSGRVFPTDMKAAPMLRAWVHRLRSAGVTFHMRHRWVGDARTLTFTTPDGESRYDCDARVLALGGASWPRLGSDAQWVPALRAAGVAVHDFKPANCGFDVDWTPFFKTRFAGHALKTVAMAVAGCETPPAHATDTEKPAAFAFRAGEGMISEHGIEGGLIYALSASIRDRIDADGEATVLLDLLPGHTPEKVRDAVMRPRGRRSLSSHLQGSLGLSGVKSALLHECLPKSTFDDPERLAASIKALPLRLLRPRPIAEAISSAGGVAFEALDDTLMIARLPGTFCAGEMLDWEAPTGGYLLSACFASGRAAGQGVLDYLADVGSRRPGAWVSTSSEDQAPE